MNWRAICAALGIVLAIAWWTSGISARALDEREHALGIDIIAGDLVFQDLTCGERCDLIREVTKSRYVHVGIVEEQDGERVVWEAFGPVGPVPLAEWVRRGDELAVYRPAPALQSLQPRVHAALREMQGRPYDVDYQWDDEAIYCSELIAKAYANVLGRDLIAPTSPELGQHATRIRTLSRGRLTDETAMVSPADLVHSGHFERVVDQLR